MRIVCHKRCACGFGKTFMLRRLSDRLVQHDPDHVALLISPTITSSNSFLHCHPLVDERLQPLIRLPNRTNP